MDILLEDTFLVILFQVYFLVLLFFVILFFTFYSSTVFVTLHVFIFICIPFLINLLLFSVQKCNLLTNMSCIYKRIDINRVESFTSCHVSILCETSSILAVEFPGEPYIPQYIYSRPPSPFSPQRGNFASMLNPTLSVPCEHRRRSELEAKVVASDWGTESLLRQLFCLCLFETNG